MNSKDYVLPINNNVTLNIHSGTTYFVDGEKAYFGEDSKAYKATEEQTQYRVENNNGLGLPPMIFSNHFETTPCS